MRADERADQLASALGRGLKDARHRQDISQRVASSRAGLSQTAWSRLEAGAGARVSLRVLVRASWAVDADLHAYLEAATATHQPRDAVHLRHQELVARIARGGGWTAVPELHVAGAGFADVGLRRSERLALVEIWTWLADVGDAFRSWDRKLRRAADTGFDASGCWVLRATRRNRQLVADHATIFAARFPGKGAAWLAALSTRDEPMPAAPALLWVSVRGDRLFAARIRQARR